MAYLFYSSATWRRMVAKSRESPLFFLGVSAACVVGFGAAAVAIQSLTNPDTVYKGSETGSVKQQLGDKEKQLLLQGRSDAAIIGRVNRERLGQLLQEVKQHHDTEDRYAAALRGETLVGPPENRHTAAGSSSTHHP